MPRHSALRPRPLRSNLGRPGLARHSRQLKFESLEVRRVLATMYAVDELNSLLTFDSANPSSIISTVSITGLGALESIRGIDARPATGQLYALGITDNGLTRAGQIYTINPASGVATAVGSP